MKRLYDKNAVSDLVLLETIDEDNILKTLRERHKKDMIYTYIGSVLLSVNPFKLISNLYTPSAVESYRGRYMYELPPHVYALSEDTYRSLLTDYKDQCVIISGESGAGKTEASKKIMEYIAAVSGSGDEIERVKDQILKSNPVLEAFGNAKTVRNDNSSRFGKYMEIYFDFRGDPVGGRITNYLLEKSRVVQPALNERSFHIFYQLCAGLTEAEKKGYYITKPDDYAYLRKSQCFEVERMDDKADFELTIDGMSSMGMTDDEIGEVFRVVSAVMWLGNVEFVAKGDKSDVADAAPLKVVSHLLGCTMDKLQAALTSRTIEAGVGMQAVQTFLDKSAAEYTRDALAKVLYFRLFDWIVARINTAIDLSNIKQFKTTKGNVRTIGVLDIYGFEIFETNSFEQFCINYCNEKLQQIFIEKTLKSEQEEYKAEGIEWVPVEYFNNKIVCDLIEAKPAGLLAYLDEDSLLGQGTDASYLDKIHKNFSEHPHFARINDVKAGRSKFVIKHYAGDVQYSVEGFIDKNKDLVWRDLVLVGETSAMKIVKDMFPPGDAAQMGKRRPVTAGYQFVKQVNLLMDTLGLCVPHYIRCIKPNSQKRAGLFEDALVLHQIRYLGLLENVRVRRAGFAFRMTFTRFLQRYKMLSPATWPHWTEAESKGVHAILSGMGMQPGDTYQLGKTKIFIRNPVSLFSLEELRERKLHDIATYIQKVYRAWKARKYFLELREKALGLLGKHKLRRKVSVRRYYLGDYLGLSGSVKIQGMLKQQGSSRILFCDTVDKVNNKYKAQARVLVLTDQSVFNLQPQTYKIRRRIDIRTIGHISLSTKADNYLVIHVPEEWDYLFIIERKTEFLTALSDQYKLLTGKELQVTFADSFTYFESTGMFGKKRDSHPRHITFVDADFEGVKAEPDPANKGTKLIVKVGKIETVNERYLASVAPSFMKKGGAKPTKGGASGINVQGSATGGRFANMAPKTEEKQPAPAQKQAPVTAYMQNQYTREENPEPSKELFCRGIADFKAQDAQELSFQAGDVMRVLSQEPDGWWSAELNGKLGYIPKTYVEVIEKPGRPRGSSRGVPLPRRPQ